MKKSLLLTISSLFLILFLSCSNKRNQLRNRATKELSSDESKTDTSIYKNVIEAPKPGNYNQQKIDSIKQEKAKFKKRPE